MFHSNKDAAWITIAVCELSDDELEVRVVSGDADQCTTVILNGIE
jgi:hypothetical protein